MGAVSSFIVDEKEVNSSQLNYLKSVNEGFVSDLDLQTRREDFHARGPDDLRNLTFSSGDEANEMLIVE